MFGRVAVLVSVMVAFGAGCGGESSSPELREGRSIYAQRCSTCHGDRGQGGVGPALDQVLTTWPSCTDQQLWISLGSEGWSIDVGPTYGATGKTINGVMPGQSEVLTAREIALVAAFQRVEYGGAQAEVALAECGVAPG